MIGTFIDRAIGLFAPGWAANRMQARATMSQLQALTGGKGGYWGALGSVLKNPRIVNGNHSENAVDPTQFPQLVNSCWEIYRTNPHFKKIVRSVCSKVLGRNGLMPNSQAVREDDSPFEEFRARAKKLWHACEKGIDFRGMPGQGGETLPGIQHLALKTIMLSGEQLFSMRAISQIEQDARYLPVPMTIQLIDPQRLADNVIGTEIPKGHTFYRGIELDADRRRHAYWLNDYEANTGNVVAYRTQPKPFSAARIYHVYLKEDDDQLRGTTWFAAALMPAKHGTDLRFNVVKTSSMQACVVLSYALSAGKKRFGKTPAADDDLVDEDGNVIERFAPGMCINKGKDGKVDMHSPNINVSGYEGLIAGVSRDEAAALPGVKASTVTGDYRNSSFSSERSADNDCWPELEVIQDWFAAQFCQPAYEAIVTAAVADGYFDDVPGFNAGMFNRDRSAFLACSWQGPVARSINPVDDENAAELRLRGARSSPQRECAKQGTNFAEILKEIAEARKMVADADLPEVVFNSMMGLDTKDLLTTDETQLAKTNGGSLVSSN